MAPTLYVSFQQSGKVVQPTRNSRKLAFGSPRLQAGPMLRNSNLMALLFAVAGCTAARGQTPVPIYIELQNVVEYQMDVSDLSKWGTNPNITPGSIAQGKGVGCV